jgi:excisionase family DNA binding protein
MSYTIREAAKSTGRSKATIHRAVQSGRVSATKDEATGEWRIDPAELHRVFPAVSMGQMRDGELRQSEIADETAILRVQLEQERAERQRERAQLERTIDDLRERLDREAEERRKLTAILTDQRIKAAPDVIVAPPPVPSAEISPPAEKVPATGKRKGWLGWLTG